MHRRRSDPAALTRAARELFVRYGVRKTSMDDVAKEAGVAKGTVYLAFSSKDELFHAVCVDVCAEVGRLVDQAVAGAADPVERVVRRLDAKYAFLHSLLNESPHAGELLASKDSLAADELRRMDRSFRRGLAQDLEVACAAKRVCCDDVDDVAAMLVRAARSCGQPDEGEPSPSLKVMRKRLDRVVRLMLAGLQP